MVRYLVLLFLLSQFLLAQDGGIPGFIFLYGTGGRASSMGGAYTGSGRGVESIYYNPAGPDDIVMTRWFLGRSEIYTSDVKLDVFGFSKPVTSKGNIGMLGLFLHSPKFTARDRFGNELGEYNFVQFATLVNFSYRLKQDVRLGFNFKAIYSRLFTYSAFGYGLDLGLLYQPFRRMKMGLAILNAVPPRLTYFKDREVFSPFFRAGMAVEPIHDLLINFDVVKPTSGNYRFYAGAEFGFSDILYIRGGFDRNEALGGIGIRFSTGGRMIELSYTYSMNFVSRLAMCNTHRIGLEFTLRTEKLWAEAEPDYVIITPDTLPPMLWIRLHVFPGKDVASWRLRLKSIESDVVIRSFGGGGAPPLRIPYDFLDDRGNFIPEGEYIYEFEVTYLNGKTKFSKGKLFRLKYGSE